MENYAMSFTYLYLQDLIQQVWMLTVQSISYLAGYWFKEYRISANSFRGNYSFLNLNLCTVTKVTVHTGAETIQGRKLFAEIR